MPNQPTRFTAALDNYTNTEHQVWASTPGGGLFAYRTELIYSVAMNWAKSWNAKAPADVPEGTTFLHVVATTRYQEV